MKKLFLLAGALLAAGLGQSAQAQTLTTIGAARAAGPAYGATGSAITVTGIVTNGAELGAIRYFQDGTGGIAAYGATGNPFLTAFNNVKLGDSIVVSGTLVNYKGLLEINPITALTVVASNKPLPEPVAFTTATMSGAYAEKYEGQLVRLNQQTSFTTTTGGAVTSIAGGTSYIVSKVATAQVFVNAASTAAVDGLIGQTAPTSTFDIIGIMSQYGRTAAQANSGYQLLPRLAADLVLPNLPNFAGQPYPTDLATNSFTVNFKTQNPGDTHVAWGLTATDLTAGSASSTDATTAHSIALTGLQPATVYYVQVSSSNAVGTSRSLPVPMITVSQSSGRMWAYFNNPVNVAAASPATNRAVYAPNGSIADTLARYIGRATKTLDIAIYNWNNKTIQTAVNAASARGVRVRIVYDGGNANASIPGLSAGIAKGARQNPSGTTGIMHNKFVVIDANSTDPNVPIVWTGSTNWTSDQLYAVDRNSAIVLQDQSLARVYTMEFEEMWGGSGDQHGTLTFGANKVDNTPHYLRIGGRVVQSWFSPSDNVNSHIIETAQTADNDLHIASMQITRSDIAQAIRDQINLRGIKGCTEAMTDDTIPSDGTGATTRIFRQAIGDRMMVKPKGAGYIFHHKYMLVDAGMAASDPTLLVGSHNWSAAANSTNDENTLIIHDNAMVNQYYQEFVARIPEMNKNIVPCTLTLLATRGATVQQSTAVVYPNPAHGSFRVVLPGTAARTATVTLRDVLGRVAYTQTLPLTGTELRVEAGNLPAGVYLVQLVTPEATQVSRVVVE